MSTFDGARFGELPPGATARIGNERLRHPTPITGLIATGQRLISTCSQRVRVWDADTGALVLELDEGSQAPDLAPDGRSVGLAYVRARLLDLDTGEHRYFDRVEPLPSCVAFSADQETLLGGDHAGRLIAWEVASGAPATVMKVCSDHVVALKRVGDAIAALDWRGRGAIVDPRRRRVVRELRACRPLLAVSSDGEYFACPLSPDGIDILDAGGKQVRFVQTRCRAIAFDSQDRLHAVDDEGNLTTFSLDGSATTTRLGLRGISQLAFDGAARITVASEQGLVRFGVDGQRLDADETPTGAITSIATRGHLVAASSSDGFTRIWDREGWKRCAFRGSATELRFSPDGTQLGLAELGRVQVIDCRPAIDGDSAIDDDSALSRSTFEVSGFAWSIDFSPDGTTLAFAGAAGASVVRLPDGEPQRLPKRQARAVAFSRDGGTLFVGHEDGRLQAWDRARNALRWRGTMKREIGCLALSPDGATLAAGDDAATIRLWDASTGARGARLDADGGAGIRALAWAPHAPLLVHLDFGGVSIWDVEQAEVVQRLACDPHAIDSIAFLPDGRLVTGTRGGTLLFWPIDPAAGGASERARRAIALLLARAAGAAMGPYREVRPPLTVRREGGAIILQGLLGAVSLELEGSAEPSLRLACIRGVRDLSPEMTRSLGRWLARLLEPADARAARTERVRAVTDWARESAIGRVEKIAVEGDDFELAIALEAVDPEAIARLVLHAHARWLT